MNQVVPPAGLPAAATAASLVLGVTADGAARTARVALRG